MRTAILLTAAGLSLLASPAVVTAAAEEPATAAKSQPKDDPNRLICRRIEESGSLARRRRVCYTRAEWDRIAELQRNNSPQAGAFSGGTNGN